MLATLKKIAVVVKISIRVFWAAMYIHVRMWQKCQYRLIPRKMIKVRQIVLLSTRVNKPWRPYIQACIGNLANDGHNPVKRLKDKKCSWMKACLHKQWFSCRSVLRDTVWIGSNMVARFARWYILIPICNAAIWVNFGVPWNGKYWYKLWPLGIFTANLCILWTLGKFRGYLVIFSRFGIKTLATLVVARRRTTRSQMKITDRVNRP
jgi:hypothetical protein